MNIHTILPSPKMAFIIFLLAIFLHAAHGELVCEELPIEMCSFSISSSGKRCCLFETPVSRDQNSVQVHCRTSDAMVNNTCEHIESDECVDACGVDRNAVGMSSDYLLEPQFMAKLCSPECYKNCPNILHLYSNLALAEGAFLPALCDGQEIGGSRREMAQLLGFRAAPYVAKLIASDNPTAKYKVSLYDTYVVAGSPMSAKYVVAKSPVYVKYFDTVSTMFVKYVVAESPMPDDNVFADDAESPTSDGVADGQ